MFIAALFAIAKIWKQSKCPSIDMNIKNNCGHAYNGILLSHKKRTLTICDHVDGPRGYCAN